MAMSNTASSPDIVPLIVGPSLLMLTGVLFLWDYAGGYTVSQTWPLLLIVLGLGKVAERILSRPPDHDRRPEEAK